MTTTPDKGRSVQIDRRALRWRWPVLVGAAVVGLLAGSLVAARKAPGYEATAVTAIVPARSGSFPGADYVSLAAPSFIAYATSPQRSVRRAADRHRRRGPPFVRTGGRARSVQHDHRDGARRRSQGCHSSCERDRLRDDQVPRRGVGGGRRRTGDNTEHRGRRCRWPPQDRGTPRRRHGGPGTRVDAGATTTACRGRRGRRVRDRR